MGCLSSSLAPSSPRRSGLRQIQKGSEAGADARVQVLAMAVEYIDKPGRTKLHAQIAVSMAMVSSMPLTAKLS